ncbi:putative glycine rich protein [Helianthus annuus]|nr:putative glycine rich protein [Helianthus annuus]KAJ0820180.1 putative glycine rich protein [Helianthus annuus]KAJ0834746.1 putative glycine rich protein [Helianthus annuus]
MASKTFLLLALVFAVVLLITSEVAARDLASNHDGEVDGRSGYNHGSGGHGGYNNGGGQYNVDGRGGYNKGGGHGGHGGHGKGRGGRGGHGGEEATAYKETQN